MGSGSQMNKSRRSDPFPYSARYKVVVVLTLMVYEQLNSLKSLGFIPDSRLFVSVLTVSVRKHYPLGTNNMGALCASPFAMICRKAVSTSLRIMK